MKQWLLLSAVALTAAGFVGCATCCKQGGAAKAPFGTMPDGTPIEIYTLQNKHGMEARIINYGGTVVSLRVPDRNGRFDDIVLGYDHLDGYLTNSPYFGCLVGRYGNRIGGAKFTLNGQTYKLAANNGPNSLHGGVKGFDKVVWTVVKSTGNSLTLRYLSKDGEEGFPGNLDVTAIYKVTDDNELKVEFSATTDKPTVCNLTHHSYFNLAGQGKGTILDHQVQINSDKITPVNQDLITTGEYADVTGTPFDFRKPTAVGARINDPDRQLQYGPGYDHNWVIQKPLGQYGWHATVYEPTTGRVMEVWSNEPGMQFYAGNFLDGTIIGKGGAVYPLRSGFCMEPQHYPDSPNKPNFPPVTLLPGETYKCTIAYKFSVR
ncbi:MAG TPA: aldose epimerase family protein [Verrucomicrobiota bacterium]|nr:aldose epimerase family protein [Verrucomicrobiota bacterium]